jgi:hypothetical protein
LVRALVRRGKVVCRRPSLGHHETPGRLVAALHLKRQHQRPLLGSGLHGFLVGGVLEVGEVISVDVVV